MNRRAFIGSATGLSAALTFPAGRSSRFIAKQLPAELVGFSASQLSAAIQQRQVSCVEVMQAYLDGLANDSGGGMLFLAGESGIGKTRLAIELTRRAELKEYVVLTGECVRVAAAAGPRRTVHVQCRRAAT